MSHYHFAYNIETSSELPLNISCYDHQNQHILLYTNIRDNNSRANERLLGSKRHQNALILPRSENNSIWWQMGSKRHQYALISRIEI